MSGWVWRRAAVAVVIGAVVLGDETGAARAAGGEAADVEEEAAGLNRRVVELYRAGKYDEAIPLAKRALANLEKALGLEHPDVAALLNNLALLCKTKGDYATAEPLYRRALAIKEKALGPEHPSVATSLDNLAGLYQAKGDYAAAEPLYRRVLAILEKALGPEHPSMATSLNNLAALYQAKGDYAAAESLYRRALAIDEKALGLDHSGVAIDLNNLALLYQTKGDYAAAEPLYRRALTIDEKALGLDHPEVAADLNNLAGLYKKKGDYVAAESLYRRALASSEKALGPEHPHVAASLNNLAGLYQAKGNYAAAEPLYRRALASSEKALGPEHPDVAASLNNLAGFYQAKGDYAVAEPLYHRALTIWEKVLGPEHPHVAASLANLSTLHWAKGELPRALAYEQHAGDIQERNLALIFTTGSESQKRAYLGTLSGTTNADVTLAARAARAHRDAARLALTTVLRRKGRVLDAMANSLSALRRRLDSGDRKLLEALTSLRSELATLTLGGPKGTAPAAIEHHHAETRRLQEEAERLEAEMSARSAGFRAIEAAVTIEAVQSALPEKAALVEWVSYHPFNPKAAERDRWGESRYAACVLHRSGDPQWVDLGDAAAIDRDVETFRAAVSDFHHPQHRDVTPLARALEAKIMAPVRRLLGETRRLFLSPDGALNLVPFAALVDDTGQALVERHALTYLTSGRDLLRFQIRAPAVGAPLVAGAPSFGPMPAKGAANRGAANEDADIAAHGQRSRELRGFRFDPLPGTKREAEVIAALFGGTTPLLGESATEAAVKELHGPRILHIATHGFFLPVPKDTPDKPAAWPENPLLRSGLALAGANLRKSGERDDGILTALEVSAMNLDGTRVVALSACETGIGQATSGDGVYGLRRGLVLAGAETQVMSLWKVDDDVTRGLMEDYYRALLRGEGRSEAMRQVQLASRADARTSHPVYWASFVVSGNPTTLEGAAAAPNFGRVVPGARGCACATVRGEGDARGEALGMALGITLAAVAWRRRCARMATGSSAPCG